jgi:hypothetical protein
VTFITHTSRRSGKKSEKLLMQVTDSHPATMRVASLWRLQASQATMKLDAIERCEKSRENWETDWLSNQRKMESDKWSQGEMKNARQLR